MADLVRATLRLRPDRIVVGEVRGSEALDLLKAWGTGHPGGIATVHAGSAHGALTRLEQLVQEVSVTVPRALIAETVNVVAVLSEVVTRGPLDAPALDCGVGRTAGRGGVLRPRVRPLDLRPAR